MNRHLSARRMFWVLVAIVLFALLPIISVLASSGIASLGDCELNEARAHSCVIVGIDVGDLLTFMFVAGWLALVTLPIGAAAVLIWMIVAIFLGFRARRMSKRRSEDPSASAA